MSGHVSPASSNQEDQRHPPSPPLSGTYHGDHIVFWTPSGVPGHEDPFWSLPPVTETVNTGREDEVTQEPVQELSLIPTGSARSTAFNHFMQSYRPPNEEASNTPGRTPSMHPSVLPQHPRFSGVTLKLDQNDGWTVTCNVQVDGSEGVVRSLSVSLEFWCDPNEKTGKPWRLSIRREESPGPPGAGTKESMVWGYKEYMTRSGVDELMAKVYDARYGTEFTEKGGYFSTAQAQVWEQTLYKDLKSKIPADLCSRKPRIKSLDAAP
jgi:hypothetical protein